MPLNYDDYLESVSSNFSRSEVEPELLFETSRGCWWGERAHCTFCGLNGSTMQYRAMAPKGAVERFQQLFDHAPEVTHFKAVDNILPREYLTEVFPKLSPPRGTSIFYEVKADLKDAELATLAAAGVNVVQPASRRWTPQPFG